MGVYTNRVPLEDLLKLVTPKSIWFPVKPISAEDRAALMAKVVESGVHTCCSYRHANHCILEAWRKTGDVTQRSLKLYFLVHVIPYLIFKKNNKEKYSKKGLLKLSKGILRSLSFIAGFAFIGEIFLCYMPSNLSHFSGNWCAFASGMCAASVFFEQSSRWGEFAMTVFPRLLESFKPYLAKQQRWTDLPRGLNIMAAFAFATISHLYFTDRDCVKQQFRSFFSLIFGKAEFQGEKSVKGNCGQEKGDVPSPKKEESLYAKENLAGKDHQTSELK